MKTNKNPKNPPSKPKTEKPGDSTGDMSLGEPWKEMQEIALRVENEMREDIASKVEFLKRQFESYNSPDLDLLIENEKRDIKSLLFGLPVKKEARDKHQWICNYAAGYILKGKLPYYERSRFIFKGSFSSMFRDWAVEANSKYEYLKWLESVEPTKSSKKNLRISDLGILLQNQTEIKKSNISESFCAELAKRFPWTSKRIGHDIRKAYTNADGIKDIPESVKEFLKEPDKAITLLKKSYPLKNK